MKLQKKNHSSGLCTGLSKDSARMMLADAWYSPAEFKTLKSNVKCVPLLARQCDFRSQIYFMPFVLKYPLAIQYLLGLRRNWVLSHTVKCLSIVTQYKNLDLLSWSVFSYKTIGSTKVIKSCKTYSCKTWGMAFRGNEGSPVTAKWNLIFFFRAATSSFVISLDNILWSAHVQ